MIKVTCSQCQTTVEVEDRYAGQSGKCRNCGAPITVPVPEQPVATGLDALREPANVAPENFGAYGKAADAHWVDPAEKAAEAEKKAADVVVPLPEVPTEILAAVKARQRQTLKYVIGAALITLIVLVLLLPLLMPSAPTPASPRETPPVPQSSEPTQ